MNVRVRHDSRSLLYRRPGGAQPCGEEIDLTLQAEGDETNVCLRLWCGDGERLLPMEPGEGGFFHARIRLPDTPCLVWYYFVLTGQGGETAYYGNAQDGLGGEGQLWDHEPPSFQITVYDPAYATPEWMGEGIMYQIFPDRFHASRPTAGRKHPTQGWYHEDWNEAPTPYREPAFKGEEVADDFFGGDLRGIEEKLPYLKDLGVTVLYLNPIFRARSNHKYDTGDYRQIDPAFGTQEDLTALCGKARALGIRVMLDGVFSHTGSDSRYFNRFGHYEGLGAYQSKESPYAGWYRFERWPDKYECWWDFENLPNVEELAPGYLEFMIHGEDAVTVHYPRLGTSGWRLDVADELPMEFIRRMRSRLKAERPDAALLGEVWEDASHKEAYGAVRSYCLGDTLDSVMNYPLREGLIDFLTGKIDAPALKRQLDSLYENYAPPFARSLMNLLGSHDRPRIITLLSGEETDETGALTSAGYERGRERFLAAWGFVCALPGMPSLYYGDEAGLTGGADPYCRGTYPWGREDGELIARVRGIIRERLDSPAALYGSLTLETDGPDRITVRRQYQGSTLTFTLDRREQ